MLNDSRMLRAAALLLALAVLLNLAQPPPTHAATSALAFRNDMRKLWEDHITWTRLYIVSAAADLPDKEATAQRLLQNQADIGNAIKPYYGEDAGNQLTALLREHILGAADLLAAAKAGDQAKVAEASAKWYANANDIAAALNGLDQKSFPLATVQDMMKMHLDLTLQEATDRLSGNFAADIQDYDKVHAEILTMADALSAGVLARTALSRGGAPTTLPVTGGGSPLPFVWPELLFGVGLIALGSLLAWRREPAVSQEQIDSRK